MACDSVNHVLAWQSNSGSLLLKDVSSQAIAGNNTIITATISGGTIPTVGSIVYDPVNKQYLIVGTSGKTLTKITIPNNPLTGTYIVNNFTPAGGDTPGSATANGTYGRAQVLTWGSYAVLVWILDETQDVYFYRLS